MNGAKQLVVAIAGKPKIHLNVEMLQNAMV
jgi:hypothetical protein